MFKNIQGVIINKNAIKKITECGFDPKDEKEHCKIIFIGDSDECGLDVSMSLDELINALK